MTIVPDSSYSYTNATIYQFSLNTEQILALRIVAEHVSAQHIDSFNQLLMGIFGEGGTGKSTLIEAIRTWFVVQGRQEELTITAMTGSAASHISAVTLHSATGISIEDTDMPKTAVSNITRIAEWTGRQYLIIDEISLLD